MSHAAIWATFQWAVRAGIVLWLVVMLRAAWKDNLPGTLAFGALLTLFIGVYPALHFSHLGEYIRDALAGTLSSEAPEVPVTKRVSMAVLWCILFAVPGPFIAVVVQVIFRTFKRARGGA